MTLYMELMNCEDALLREIAEPELHRKDIALTYAFAVRSSENATINWSKVNGAIIKRWSISALEWIKREAWKRINK